MRILPLKVDVVFKMLFGDPRNKDILTDFLKSALDLDASEYDNIEIIDPHLNRDLPDEKLGILDVKVKTTSGGVIDVEIQVVAQNELRDRIVFYLSRLITEQLSIGGGYGELRRAICMFIMDETLISESERYHTVFKMQEIHEHFPFSDLLEIDILELNKLMDNSNEALENWLKFIRADNEEEFEMVSETSPMIKEAYARLKVLSSEERNQLLAESRHKAQWDEQARLRSALRQGKAEGIVEGKAEGLSEGMHLGLVKGKAEGKVEIVQAMLDDGMPLDKISAFSGFSMERIRELQMRG